MDLQNLNNPNNNLNFSGGPGALPESVLNATQAAIMNVRARSGLVIARH